MQDAKTSKEMTQKAIAVIADKENGHAEEQLADLSVFVLSAIGECKFAMQYMKPLNQFAVDKLQTLGYVVMQNPDRGHGRSFTISWS